jgi:TfoX/Sxy family transcriptional regulator of competence genes
MAYNIQLAERIRTQVQGLPVVEKKMFGGVGFLIHGNMACGVHKENMIVRVEPDQHEKLLKKKHTRVFDITGKPMKGWLIVEPQGCKTSKQLADWVKKGVDFALTLPPK